jgi:hypothetical protein
MDRETLIGIVEKQHHFRVDPNDPVFVLATIAEVIQQEAREELQKTIAEALNQVAAVNQQAEAAVKAKAEAIVTQAGAQAAERIRVAGEAVAARILADMQKVQKSATADARRIRRTTLLALFCGLASVVASILTIVKMLGG